MNFDQNILLSKILNCWSHRDIFVLISGNFRKQAGKWPRSNKCNSSLFPLARYSFHFHDFWFSNALYTRRIKKLDKHTTYTVWRRNILVSIEFGFWSQKLTLISHEMDNHDWIIVSVILGIRRGSSSGILRLPFGILTNLFWLESLIRAYSLFTLKPKLSHCGFNWSSFQLSYFERKPIWISARIFCWIHFKQPKIISM